MPVEECVGEFLRSEGRLKRMSAYFHSESEFENSVNVSFLTDPNPSDLTRDREKSR